jgi:hypothetical protein
MMFAIRTEEKPAQEHLPRRVLVYNNDDLFIDAVPYRDDLTPEENHRAALQKFLDRWGIWPAPDVVGSAPLGGTMSWVTLLQPQD